MELIDLYDENRVFTGEIIERGKPIEPGRYKLSVHMWVVNSDGQVYIQKRAKSRKLFPDLWENPGGGVISGQDAETTLKREFKEELGIDLVGKFKLIKTIRRQRDFVDIFLVEQNFDISSLNLQEEEVSDAKWATLDDIYSMINDGLFCPTIMDSLNPFLEYMNNKA